MSGAGTPTPGPTATPASPDPSPSMRRKLTRKSWALLVFLSINVAAAVIALVVAALADKFTALWAFILAQLFYLQIPLIIWMLGPPSALAWFWWRASARAETLIQVLNIHRCHEPPQLAGGTLTPEAASLAQDTSAVRVRQSTVRLGWM